MMITRKEIAIDHGLNPQYGADCPLCGNDQVSRNCLIGVAVKDGARLCDECIEKHMPGATMTLDYLWDLQCALEAAPDLDVAATTALQLLTNGIAQLLIDPFKTVELTEPTLRSVPDAG